MFSRKLIHYITALTVAMSSLAPSISQAIAVASDAQGLTMEICIADGGKLAIDLQTDGKSAVMLDCPYCVAQTPVAIPLCYSAIGAPSISGTYFVCINPTALLPNPQATLCLGQTSLPRSSTKFLIIF